MSWLTPSQIPNPAKYTAFTWVASVISLEYAGTTSSGTPKSQLPQTCWVSRTSLSGDVIHLSGLVWLDNLTPANHALKLAIATWTRAHPNSSWRWGPGCPRNPWIQQIGNGTPFSIRAERSRAHSCGHSWMSQRTSAVRDLMMMMMMTMMMMN